MSRNYIIKKGVVLAVVFVFILTAISSAYAGTVFNEMKSLNDESIKTEICNIEKITDRESLLENYDLSKTSFKQHQINIDRKPTIIDGKEWDIVVPDDFSSIQTAVYVAENYDRIFVRSGTYEENIIIGVNDCSLTIRGENKNTTIIIGQESGHVISTFEAGDTNGFNISGFTIENSGRGYAGVYLCSDYNTLQGNVIKSNSYGVKISKASGNIVQGNVLIDNIHDGVVLDDYSYGNTIEENYISANDDGVKIDRFSTFNVISGNVVEDNMGCGMRVNDVSRSTVIIWNTVRGNNIGVDCRGVSDGIFAHHNSFIDNDLNAFDSSVGEWDSGTIGNYWSNYEGTDADGDGIGDEPYSLSGGNNSDNYPLMSPSIMNCSLKQSFTIYESFKNSVEPKQKQSTIIFEGDAIIVPDDFPTIQEAVDYANIGDIIFVRAGLYYENVIVDKQLKIEGEGSDVTFVSGSGLDKHVFTLHADFVQISGFTIWDCGNGFSGVRVYGDNCKISNNILRDCGGGVELWKTYNSTVDNNTVNRNIWGVYVHFSENCNILNNSIKDNFYGIELGESPINISINRIEDNNLNGVLCLRSSNSTYINNLLVSNGDIGLQMFSSDYTIIDNNLFYDNNGDSISIYDSSYNKIENNRINTTNRFDHGFSLWYLSLNNYIEYNVFSSIEINIQMDAYSIDAPLSFDSSSGKNEIRNNFFYGPENLNGLIKTNGIEINSDYNIVKNNNISNYCPGVCLSHCNYNVIDSNLISIKKEKINFYTAIDVGYKCNYNAILDNIIIGKSGISNHGIDLGGCENTTIDNNTIYGFSGRISGGIIVDTQDKNFIKNNTITENYFGICDLETNLAWRLLYFEIIYTIFQGGSFSPMSLLLFGLELLMFIIVIKNGFIMNSEIKNNVIMNNKIGISSNLLFCLIEKNLFEQNQKFGIKFNIFSMGNIIRLNNFIDNNIHATFNSHYPLTIVWNNNYWDNWNTVFPKPIFGWSNFARRGIMHLKPTIKFDWLPAQEPYDIGI